MSDKERKGLEGIHERRREVRIEDVNEDKTFKPCYLRLESMKEVELIYAIFDHSTLITALGCVGIAGKIRESLTARYSEIDFMEMFDKLNALMK